MMLGKALKMSILRGERVGCEGVDGTVIRKILNNIAIFKKHLTQSVLAWCLFYISHICSNSSIKVVSRSKCICLVF